MSTEQIIEQVLREYPGDIIPEDILSIQTSKLSGCNYWYLNTSAGPKNLRCWPKGKPTLERLQYIQAVLWLAVAEGFEMVPLPLETKTHQGFVVVDEQYWELLPWMDGAQDVIVFSQDSEKPDRLKLDAKIEPHWVASAMMTLAQFHEATTGFPLPNPPKSYSPGIRERLGKWKRWMEGDLLLLEREILFSKYDRCDKTSQTSLAESEFQTMGLSMVDSAKSLSGKMITLLSRAARFGVSLQPAIENADRRHLLFDEDGVCAMIDFKELGVDNVALDIALLLGTLAGPDQHLWHLGMSAYQSIRPLSDDELYLVAAFDIADMLLPALDWLDNIFIKRRKLTGEQLESIFDKLRWLLHRTECQRFGKSRFAA